MIVRYEVQDRNGTWYFAADFSGPKARQQALSTARRWIRDNDSTRIRVVKFVGKVITE